MNIFKSVRSNKVKNERRSFSYDPDRKKKMTFKMNNDLQAKKVYKKVRCQIETNCIKKVKIKGVQQRLTSPEMLHIGKHPEVK
jgi:hypothetical protein